MDDLDLMIHELNELFSSMRTKTKELKEIWTNRNEVTSSNFIQGDNYILITWRYEK